MVEKENHSLDFYKNAEFKEQLVNFLDDIIDSYPSETRFVYLRMIYDKVSPKKISEIICKHILPYKEYIKTHNEELFINDDLIFKNIDPTGMFTFSDLWVKKFDDEDKASIWKWFNVLLSILED